MYTNSVLFYYNFIGRGVQETGDIGSRPDVRRQLARTVPWRLKTHALYSSIYIYIYIPKVGVGAALYGDRAYKYICTVVYIGEVHLYIYKKREQDRCRT